MKLSLFLALTLLLTCPSFLDWQSAGNMSSSNMTVINSYINVNFTMGSENTRSLPAKVGKFSDYLGDLWDPAWNVVIVFSTELDKKFDAVLYGYAFRSHWVWINGYLMDAFTMFGELNHNYGSFIIWKDYNCMGWITFDDNSATNTFTTDPTTAVNTFFQTYPPQIDDIWNIAWKTVINLETVATDFKGDHAYTMIVSQSSGSYFFGKVCASSYNMRINDPIGADSTWGSYLLLQMR